MKKLRQFEIDAICDEAFKLIKEERVKQVQSKFDQSEEKEQLLDLLPQINGLEEKINKLEEKINKLRAEQNILLKKEYGLKETLRGKGVSFWRGDNKEYTIKLTGMFEVYHEIKRELILQGIDEGVKVKNIIKELVDKFK